MAVLVLFVFNRVSSDPFACHKDSDLEMLGGFLHFFFGGIGAELVDKDCATLIETVCEVLIAFGGKGDVDDATVGGTRGTLNESFAGKSIDDRRHLLFGDGDLLGKRAQIGFKTSTLASTGIDIKMSVIWL